MEGGAAGAGEGRGSGPAEGRSFLPALREAENPQNGRSSLRRSRRQPWCGRSEAGVPPVAEEEGALRARADCWEPRGERARQRWPTPPPPAPYPGEVWSEPPMPSVKPGSKDVGDAGVRRGSAPPQEEPLLHEFMRDLFAQQQQRLTELLNGHQRRMEELLLKPAGSGASNTPDPPPASSLSMLDSAPPVSRPSGMVAAPSRRGSWFSAVTSVRNSVTGLGPGVGNSYNNNADLSREHAEISMRSIRSLSRTRTRARRRPSVGSLASDAVSEKSWFSARSKRRGSWDEDSCLYQKKQDVELKQRNYTDAKLTVDESMSFSKRALMLINNSYFELLLACIIIGNAVSVGLQVDWSLDHVGEEVPKYFKALDYSFTIIFAVELLIRIIAEGRGFCSWENKHMQWNIFDTALVVVTIIGDLVGHLVWWLSNISMARLLRMFRLARAIRIFRVMRFFRDLRVMVIGIASSAKPLVLASVLLVLILYMYAICVLQAVSEELANALGDPSRSMQVETLQRYYGSLPFAVYTLFGFITGGHDWEEIAQPLVDIHPLMGVLNVLYVTFAIFCVLNVITGVFIKTAEKINNQDEDRAVLDLLESRKHWIREVKNLFKIADKGNTGYVDWGEFEAMMNDVRVQVCFNRLGLDVEADSAALLFELLDFEGNGLISLDDFAEGIQRVRGSARSIDICQLLYDNRVMKKQIAEIMCLLSAVRRNSVQQEPTACLPAGFNEPAELNLLNRPDEPHMATN